jgi:hypothetical protein
MKTNQSTPPEKSDANQQQTSGGRVSRLVRRVAGHLPGSRCLCAAQGESECGCSDVDWRSKREIALQTALEHCLSTLKSYHTTKPGITETIRQTEIIRDAGNYRPKLRNTGKQNAKRST